MNRRPNYYILMNNSTQNVTLNSAFILDIINQYEGKPEFQNHLKEMASAHELSDPMGQVPIKLYNDMCNWIESQIGKTNARQLGRKIGNTVYRNMLEMKLVKKETTPLALMKGLKRVTELVIKDPEKRGWEILSSGRKQIIMRRTQTFNGALQSGLLDELIRKTKVFSPKVEYLQSIANGDEYDDYKITWI